MNISPDTYAHLVRRVDQLAEQVTALLALVGARAKPRNPSIDGFCQRHGISRSTYMRLRRAGNGPRETAVGANRLTITEDDERAWIDARRPEDTREQRTRGGALLHRTAAPASAAE
jgi:hypothetical protein